MSITAYTGLPGSGKSFTVVKNVILPALKEGRTVWTNIPLHDELVEQECGRTAVSFDVKDIIENPGWFSDVLPKGATLVIDECWRLWPSGLKANNAQESHKSFLAEHRHMVGDDGRSTEIVLVTQDVAQLAAFVRQLIEKTFRTKKLDAVGQSKRFRLDIFEGAVTGANPPLDKRVREIYGEYSPDVYKFYKSHTKSETGAAGNEEKADGRANILKGGTMKAILIAPFVLLPLVILGGIKTYKNFNPEKGSKVTTEASSISSGDVAAEPAPRRSREKGFLDDKVVEIVWNVKNSESIDYRFRVTQNDNRTTLGLNELFVLGYEVRPINECLAVITGHGLAVYAMCARHDEPKGFIASAVDGATGS